MRNWTKLGGSCREYTLLRDNAASKVKGWIRGNTNIGPALVVAVSHHHAVTESRSLSNNYLVMELVLW